jgi:endonuclease/exonuclease/phosphatase family metal-dependent hydrolase
MIRRTVLKSIALGGLLSLSISAARAEDTPEISVRMMSCNIRVDFLPEDAASGNDWKSRRDLCLEVIRSRKPDIVCAQEVLRGQYQDLLAGLAGFAGSGFEGPEMDGKDDGYYGIGKNPILFNQDRFDLVASGTYWLSAAPHIPGSIAEGGYRARHANWVRLKDKGTGRQFRVVNLHLDSGPGMAPVREKQIGW